MLKQLQMPQLYNICAENVCYMFPILLPFQLIPDQINLTP